MVRYEVVAFGQVVARSWSLHAAKDRALAWIFARAGLPEAERGVAEVRCAGRVVCSFSGELVGLDEPEVE